MNNKYQRYINYIVNDIEKPYLKSLEQYGLKNNEYELILSKLYNQPVTIKGDYVYDIYDINGNKIYRETSNGSWVKKEYDDNGNEIYYETSDGSWIKREYDAKGNKIYQEYSNGYWVKKEYDDNDNEIYYENSNGNVRDKR
jgi:hypothetical protein